MTSKCYCGCGQASAVSCRLRLVECDGCGIKVRMTRQVLEQVTLTCSCGGTLVPVCLEDRARAGDDQAWSELQGRMQRSEMAASAGRRSQQARRNRQAVAGLSAIEIGERVGAASLIGASTRDRFAALDADIPF